MDQFPGEAVEYLSADTIKEQSNSEYQYSIEFLNSITIGGLPPHKLKNVIKAEIITGKHAEKHAFLLRITLSLTNATLPFTFKHCQFSIQPAFVMTINKSQGQTLNWIGLYLPTPVFAHGQFYVACSRITTKKNLKIITTKDNNRNLINCTYNIIYSEVFQ
ncbi:7767_t:CDS:2 [Rhizophagus irregularis]|nr:7767_t:CDS:2 [Rhizophagus irregularis]